MTTELIVEMFQPKVSLSVEGVRRVMDSFLDNTFRENYMSDTFLDLLTGNREIVGMIVERITSDKLPYSNLGESQYGYNHDATTTLEALNITKETIKEATDKYLVSFNEIVDPKVSHEEQKIAIRKFIGLVYADESYDTTIKTYLLTHILRELTKYIVGSIAAAMESESGLNTTIN